ncbi:hypothetical protein GCM10023328_34950 [Modestobacter marinus]|uniref:Uncharacterized protein n=1 Tax=Modestobacter marinus TaxID=477641 RepID=A0ABQ2FZE1_9ACTN|nr:hypothetical protein GCM10011589_24400 [Modestobacter marinus]
MTIIVIRWVTKKAGTLIAGWCGGGTVTQGSSVRRVLRVRPSWRTPAARCPAPPPPHYGGPVHGGTGRTIGSSRSPRGNPGAS